jgi:hypothetical protein
MFVNDTNEVFKNRIDTADEVKEILKTSAKATDLMEIERAIKGVYFRNGNVNSYMPSNEYTLNDYYGFKLYHFNGQKNDFITDEEMLKVSKVINAMSNKPKVVFAIRVGMKFQYYFRIKEGKNGTGDFVDDDMKNVVKYLDEMKEAGATWRTITDLLNDIVDDVSDWAITFTVS